MNDYEKTQHLAQQNQREQELIQSLELLETVDDHITPKHVAKRFRELLDAIGDDDRSGTSDPEKGCEAEQGHSVEDLLRSCGHDEAAHISPDAPIFILPTVPQQLEKAAERAMAFALTQGPMINSAIENATDEIHQLASAYMRQPLTEILGTIVEKQNFVFSELEKRQTPDNARELYFLSSVLGGMLANAGHDLGDPQSAITHARAAFACAEDANHDGLRAWIRGMQSLISYRADRPREAIEYAKTGAVFANKVSGSTLAAWLPACEARAWGKLGNASEVLAAIERAESAWEHRGSNDLDDFGGICSTNLAELLYYSADALTLLPADTNTATTAERYCTQAVEAYQDTSSPDWDFGCQACSHADLATALLWRHEREGAVEVLAPVLKLPPQQRVNGVIQSVQRVHSVAAGSRDIQEQIEDFIRTPLRIKEFTRTPRAHFRALSVGSFN